MRRGARRIAGRPRSSISVQKGRRQDHGAARGGPGVRPEPRADRAGCRQAAQASRLSFDQTYPPNTVEFASIIRALKAAKPDIVYVASYPPDSAGILRAVNEIGIGDDVKIFGGGMVGLQFAAVMSNLGSLLNGVVNYNTWLPESSMYFDGTKAFFDDLHQARHRGQGRSARLLSGAVRLRDGPDDRGGGQLLPSRSTRRASPNICARTSTRPSSGRSRFRRMASARKRRRCRRSSGT